MSIRTLFPILLAFTLSLTVFHPSLADQPGSARIEYRTVQHRTVQIDGLDIFYREAGPAGCSGRAIAAWLSDIVAHVSKSDTRVGRQVSRDRAGLSGIWIQQHADGQ